MVKGPDLYTRLKAVTNCLAYRKRRIQADSRKKQLLAGAIFHKEVFKILTVTQTIESEIHSPSPDRLFFPPWILLSFLLNGINTCSW